MASIRAVRCCAVAVLEVASQEHGVDFPTFYLISDLQQTLLAQLPVVDQLRQPRNPLIRVVGYRLSFFLLVASSHAWLPSVLRFVVNFHGCHWFPSNPTVSARTPPRRPVVISRNFQAIQVPPHNPALDMPERAIINVPTHWETWDCSSVPTVTQ
ncbi:hypothetical protein B0I37DRAFT_150427 [Chaetomium sp. MPI-CAGE-AT-0009]|nr:hypothetical protein B0I37DRAFT_150427 [Chaetomium sp. MPI-CAGE-AT-0009]